MHQRYIYILFISLMVSSLSCTSSNSFEAVPADDVPSAQQREADFSKLTPSCFVPVGKSPIILNGDFFPGSNWNDPHVLKVGNEFVMYASADIDFVQNIKIYRFVSNDGQNWRLSPSTAVFEKSSDPTAWDRKSTETPAVIFFKGIYYMFYTGYSSQTDTASYGVGYATSIDGINWTRQTNHLSPTNPYGAPDLNFMQYIVGEPAPVVFKDKIYLYFSASGAHQSVGADMFTIGLITSEDGQNWSTPALVLTPDQSLYPRSDWKGYSTPNAVVMNGQVHLFFDVAQLQFKQVKFHHAVSFDGENNWSHDRIAIFDKSQFSWADDQINGPTVLFDSTRVYMWFGGQGNISAFPNISMGIGMAICEL